MCFKRGCTRCIRAIDGLRIALGVVLATGSMAKATDYYSTNFDALTRFFAAAENTNKPVTVVSFGDSMADSYRSPAYHLMNKLVARFGTAGYSFNNYLGTALPQLTNGAYFVNSGSMWFHFYTALPPGAGVWWLNQPRPSGTLCDSAGIFFTRHPGGGEFVLSVSTNGGVWTPALSLNGFSPTVEGAFTNLALPLNNYRIRVDGVSGTNYILGPSMVRSSTGGVHVVFMDQAGISLSQVTNVSLSIRAPVMAALKPDLIIWHMKEDPGWLPGNLDECESWWSNSIPGCDVLYIGTTWVGGDSTQPITLDQNAIVRDAALRHRRAYVDLMEPTISWTWLASQGYMQDVTHVNSAGGLHCANIIWNDMGFFALGLNRKLSVTPSGAGVQVSYATSSNAVYSLETSQNLQSWTPLLTNSPANATFTTNLAAQPGQNFLRLRLKPN